MAPPAGPLTSHLAEPSRIGTQISITGKRVPARTGGLFGRSSDSREMLPEWEDVHLGAKADPGVHSTVINHAVVEDAVLVHHVFRDPEALVHYCSMTATQHMRALTAVAKPGRTWCAGHHPHLGARRRIGEGRISGVRLDLRQPARWTIFVSRPPTVLPPGRSTAPTMGPRCASIPPPTGGSS